MRLAAKQFGASLSRIGGPFAVALLAAWRCCPHCIFPLRQTSAQDRHSHWSMHRPLRFCFRPMEREYTCSVSRLKKCVF